MPVINPSPAPLHGDSLYAALTSASASGVRIWRLDGAGVVMQSADSLCYIDPFLADGGQPGWVRRAPKIIDHLPPPTVVLLTHEHDDHTDPVALAELAKSSCLVAGPAPAIEVARSAGFLNRQTVVLTAGMRFQLGGVSVMAVKVRDAEAKAPLAYLVTIDGVTLYHGGDAQMSKAFAETGAAHSVTVACLSVAGKINGKQSYLTPNDAVKAARSLHAQVLVPVHWDLWTINGIRRSAWERVLQDAEKTDKLPSIALLEPGANVFLTT